MARKRPIIEPVLIFLKQTLVQAGKQGPRQDKRNTCRNTDSPTAQSVQMLVLASAESGGRLECKCLSKVGRVKLQSCSWRGFMHESQPM